MQTLFHKNPYRQRIANCHSCMVRVHTKPEYQMMTPDTRHTQASVQITMKTPFFYFDVITTFLRRYNDTMIQLPKRLQHSHSHCNSFNQRRSSASSAVTAAMSVHHSGLLLLFASSFQHVAFVCPNQSQCSHLILLRWGQSLNPAFDAGLTPFNAQTAVAFVN
jgi:hypothetical protein